jgi:hypothetical protein
VEAAAIIAWKPLGEMLVERGLLTVDELDDALAEQQRTGRKLGAILISRKLVSSPALTTILAEQVGVELERQHGFGSGLFALIERRNQRLAPTEGPPVPEEQPPAPAMEAPPVDEFPPGPVDELAALRAELEHERARRAELELELSTLVAKPPAPRKRSAKRRPTKS